MYIQVWKYKTKKRIKKRISQSWDQKILPMTTCIGTIDWIEKKILTQ